MTTEDGISALGVSNVGSEQGLKHLEILHNTKRSKVWGDWLFIYWLGFASLFCVEFLGSLFRFLLRK